MPRFLYIAFLKASVFFRSADAVPEYACGIAWWQIGINRKDVPFLILPESTA